MRFRATIEHVDTFIRKTKYTILGRTFSLTHSLGIIQSVEKLQKRCTIKFGEQEIRVICTGDVNEGGIQVWSLVMAFMHSFLVLRWVQTDQSFFYLHRISHTIQLQQRDYHHRVLRGAASCIALSSGALFDQRG